MCNLATHHPCLLFCHTFMQVRQGSATGKTTNQNPLPPKASILQKWMARKPPQSLPQICQLYQHHIQTPKEGQEKQHSNSYTIRQCHIMPSQGSCRHCLQDPILPRSQQRHPNLRHLAVQPHQTHPLQANQECATGRRLGNRRGHPPHHCQQDRHTLHPLGCGNGDVPWWMSSVSHHDDRLLVQQRLFVLH